jgi:sporulation protein YtfJ
MHPIEQVISDALLRVKSIVDVNTVIGAPVTLIDGTILVPISKVSVGFLAGGGEYGKQERNKEFPLSGGSGAGISLSPVGFLSVTNGEVKVVNIDHSSPYSKLFDIGGEVLKKIIKGKGE